MAVALGATAEAMGTGLTTSAGSPYCETKTTKKKHTKPHQTHAGILAARRGDNPPSMKQSTEASFTETAAMKYMENKIKMSHAF